MSLDLVDLNGRKIYEREAGILMPLISLPSKYGIGDLGKEAREFVDILHNSRQQLWAMLPNGPVGYGNSPYQSISSCAGNHYVISPELLIEDGLLTSKEVRQFDFGTNPEQIDYGKLFDNRVKMLKIAYARWLKEGGHSSQEFLSFKFCNYAWLQDYATYMYLKEKNEHKAWFDWDEKLKNHDSSALAKERQNHAKEIGFWEFAQYKFFKQWEKLKEYANQKGIKIIGDIPFYINHDSSDVWAHRDLFELNNDGSVKLFSGLPGENGGMDIRWGNPCYNWHNIKKENYAWLAQRIEKNAEMYDIMRIDHAIAFVHYYGIKQFGGGTWYEGPDMFKRSATDVIDAVARQKKMDIIVENLGNNIQRTHDLYDQLNWIGMRIFNYTVGDMYYGTRNIHLPSLYAQNVAAYTGTHDNETLTGLLATKSDKELEYIMSYLNVKSRKEILWGAIDTLYKSSACKVILPVQDVLSLDDKSRVCYRDNFEKSWQWRLKSFDAFDEKIQKRLNGLTVLSARGGMTDERINQEGWQKIFHKAIGDRYGHY